MLFAHAVDQSHIRARPRHRCEGPYRDHHHRKSGGDDLDGQPGAGNFGLRYADGLRNLKQIPQGLDEPQKFWFGLDHEDVSDAAFVNKQLDGEDSHMRLLMQAGDRFSKCDDPNMG